MTQVGIGDVRVDQVADRLPAPQLKRAQFPRPNSSGIDDALMDVKAEFVAQLDVTVGPPQLIGRGPTGERRIIPITGGIIRGPRLSGTILAGGADFQLIRSDGVAEIEARYTLALDDGALVYVVNRGLRTAAPEDMARLMRGEPVPPERVYFRTTPVFETAAPAHAWLLRQVFLGFGERQPESVRISIYGV